MSSNQISTNAENSDLYLKIVLLHATNLPAGDPELFGGKSDPYVNFRIKKEKQKSSTIPNALNPVWNPPEEFVFRISPGQIKNEVLNVGIYDWDRFNSDDLLGTVLIPIAQFADVSNVGENGHLIKTPSEVYEINVPEEHQHSNQLCQICLRISLLNEEEYNSSKTLSLWENERWIIGGGWSHDNLISRVDRKRWSSKDGKDSSDYFSDVAPEAEKDWIVERDWGYSTDQGDENGWLYATDFSGPWRKKQHTASCVRRRQWISTYCKPIVCGDNNAEEDSGEK